MVVKHKVFILDNEFPHANAEKLEQLLDKGWRILRADTNHTENKYGTCMNTVYILGKNMEWIGRDK